MLSSFAISIILGFVIVMPPRPAKFEPLRIAFQYPLINIFIHFLLFLVIFCLSFSEDLVRESPGSGFYVHEQVKTRELTLPLSLAFCFLLTFIIPRSLQFRLKSSFISQYFLFLYLGFLLSIMGAQHVNQMVFELEGNLAKQEMLAKAESFRLDLEENLNLWIERLEKGLNHSVSQGTSPAELPLPAKSQSALISIEGVDQFYPDPPAAFFEKLMYAAGPVLLTEQKDSKLKIEEVSKNWENSTPRNMDSLDYISGADAKELANTLNVHRYQKVTLFQFSVMNHFLYFLRWPNNQKYQLFFSAIPFESAVEIYEGAAWSMESGVSSLDFSSSQNAK